MKPILQVFYVLWLFHVSILAELGNKVGESLADPLRPYRLTSSISGRASRSILGSNERCLDQSEISTGTIIRTKDSRALGAKFLNESSLGPAARDQCLILCCANPDCNVAVYEERDGGNCYLFDCGSPEDFRCKFTSHSFYTSAVLRKNNHEDELAQLKIDRVATQTTAEYQTTATTTTTVQPVTEKKCSRYQFECHTSRECIAIYNACDGIPQCADGSDEAPELGCPATTTPTTTTRATITPHQIRNKMSQFNADLPSPNNYVANPEWRGNNHERWTNQDDLWNTNGHIQNSGTGASVAERHPIFGQNGNISPESERFRSQYVGNSPGQAGYSGHRYEQDIPQYNQRYYESPKAHVQPQYQPPLYQPSIYAYNWNSPSQLEPQGDTNIQNQAIPLPPVQLPQGRLPPQHHSLAAQYNGNPPNPVVIPVTQQSTVSTTNQETTSSTTVTPTTVPVAAVTYPAAVKKVEEKSVVKPDHASIHELHVNQAEFREAKLQRVRQTTGAIWALSLGLCITLILVALVGCRLRSLKWNLRRGRGSHARDEDYLVNGLYL